MKNIWSQFKELIRDEEGQVAFEYFSLVIIGVIAGAAACKLVGEKIGIIFQQGVVAEITKPYH
ncbi:Flp family type IVb pilin [candidate division CSSED10-310 bacterium]|uniref:Flp family type IVb pilin n=1 Tax=candidate division CSSED10-310 bacterium TaxID=2855610 RepID=A0ABV6YX98_UNCC1